MASAETPGPQVYSTETVSTHLEVRIFYRRQPRLDFDGRVQNVLVPDLGDFGKSLPHKRILNPTTAYVAKLSSSLSRDI